MNQIKNYFLKETKSIFDTTRSVIGFLIHPVIQKDEGSIKLKLSKFIEIFNAKFFISILFALILWPLKNWYFEVNSSIDVTSIKISGNYIYGIYNLLYYAAYEELLHRAFFTRNRYLKIILAIPLMLDSLRRLFSFSGQFWFYAIPACFNLLVGVFICFANLNNYKILRVFLLLSAFGFAFSHIPSFVSVNSKYQLVSLIFIIPHFFSGLIYNYKRIKLGFVYAVISHFIYNLILSF